MNGLMQNADYDMYGMIMWIVMFIWQIIIIVILYFWMQSMKDTKLAHFWNLN